MRVKFSSLNPVKLFIAILLIITFFLAIYFPNYTKLKKLRKANEDLAANIKKLKVEIKDLQAKVKKVNKDPLLYEKFARDELGAAKEDEIVIDIEE